jgi:hypothetical protein
MSKRTGLLWLVEFASLTAIAVILSTATTKWKWWVAIPAAVIVGAKFAEYVYDVRVRLNVIRHQLQILVKLLPSDGSTIRCTYHRPIHHRLLNRTELEQAFDYIPEGGGAGRRFSIEKGIIGKVYKIKAPRVENFPSDREYRTRMVAEYNYTATEVMERTADRRSYVCYPVLDENHTVLGLLYLDSDRPGTFTMDDSNPRWRVIRDGGQIICSNVLEGP